MDQVKPTIPEWQYFKTYDVWIIREKTGVVVEAHVGRLSSNLGFSPYRNVPKDNISSHRDGIPRHQNDAANQARIYELLAEIARVELKEAEGFIHKDVITPNGLKNSNPDLAARILQDARAYQIIQPEPAE